MIPASSWRAPSSAAFIPHFPILPSRRHFKLRLGQPWERRDLRGAVDALVRAEPAAQAHHLAHRVERIDLALDHASDLEMEAVRAKVDCRERFLPSHAG